MNELDVMQITRGISNQSILLHESLKNLTDSQLLVNSSATIHRDLISNMYDVPRTSDLASVCYMTELDTIIESTEVSNSPSPLEQGSNS